MAYPIPSTEPISIRAGDSWSWRRDDLSDWPASAWTLTYRFRNATAFFDITASADGDSFAVALTAAETADFAPGAYDWFAFVAAGDDRHQVGSGRTEVLPDILAATPYDGRGWARRMLDYVEAALLGRASSDQLDLINATLEDRGITRDKGGLMALRSQLAAEALREEQPGKSSKASRIVVRFGGAPI